MIGLPLVLALVGTCGGSEVGGAASLEQVGGGWINELGRHELSEAVATAGAAFVEVAVWSRRAGALVGKANATANLTLSLYNAEVPPCLTSIVPLYSRSATTWEVRGMRD